LKYVIDTKKKKNNNKNNKNNDRDIYIIMLCFINCVISKITVPTISFDIIYITSSEIVDSASTNMCVFSIRGKRVHKLFINIYLDFLI
jgi:hypothetical protein